ncbi:hypothetical protein EPN87_00835 [archaeon]|nr:MAG: hypothetical protein EPN87_00835 [archaeon]
MDSIQKYLPNSKLQRDGIIVGKVKDLPSSQSGELVYHAMQKLFGFKHYRANDRYLEIRGKVEGKVSISTENGRLDYVSLEAHRKHADVVYMVDRKSLTRCHIFFKDSKTLRTVSPESDARSEAELIELLESIFS